ncbi:MAG TPA: protein translocase subunit SecD [Mycobacteriales bacterium]|jgi:preprotein translocase subunit SecD|nr:protein translocase subunit SecD [Mycobacteriales bacterium]
MALLLVALYLGVFLGPSATPALGLDLRGGTEITLTAEPLSTSGTITKSELTQAVDIIRNRVNGLGVGGATTNTQGNKNIVVSVPGRGRSILDTVGQTALLRFRQVLGVANYVPTPVTTSSPSVTPSVSLSPSSKSNKKSHGDALTSALLAKPKPSTTPTPTPTASLTPSATPSTSPTVSPTPTGTTSPGAVNNQPLSGSESATLSTAFETSFANWDCSKHPNPTNGSDDPKDYIIACDPKGPTAVYKYLLAPAAIEGTQVKTASAGLSTQGISWQVNLTFTSSGSSAWYNLTKTAYEATGANTSGYGSCSPPKGCNGVAITLDGIVQSAPASQTDGIAGGLTDITGNFTQTQATDLANVLKYGSLPLKFTQSDVQTVSATLGSKQLRGGLIAGAIGLALVILFSLLYYRALGLVTIGSLAVSGLILYAVTTLLGHSSVGYTLSLPGIAGFIVAVGITADSFVVYFERLRDEIREGRRLRSAVDRAWPRARRTILSADTVSLLAAVVLYAVSIGDVRGFAFTLGLSTLSDLLIVFFFTKPLLMVLGRRPAFDSGKSWTGIGRARTGVAREEDAQTTPRRSRGKEN